MAMVNSMSKIASMPDIAVMEIIQPWFKAGKMGKLMILINLLFNKSRIKKTKMVIHKFQVIVEELQQINQKLK